MFQKDDRTITLIEIFVGIFEIHEDKPRYWVNCFEINILKIENIKYTIDIWRDSFSAEL